VVVVGIVVYDWCCPSLDAVDEGRDLSVDCTLSDGFPTIQGGNQRTLVLELSRSVDHSACGVQQHGSSFDPVAIVAAQLHMTLGSGVPNSHYVYIL
jgi:hypothetical protein